MAMPVPTRVQRVRPNVLVTGTPGTGKTTLCGLVAEIAEFRHVNVGQLVKDKELHDGFDEDKDATLYNEDKICDELEEIMSEGGNVVDFHGCDFFPERWFDLVVVLRTDNSVLYSRLKARNYQDAKLMENIEAEILQVCLDEAKESYSEDIVWELSNNTVEEMEQNSKKILDWITDYCK